MKTMGNISRLNIFILRGHEVCGGVLRESINSHLLIK